MATDSNAEGYRENDAEAIVGEIFSGKISTAEAIERLRTRLLDLSARNGLLNYRHPKNRCVQFVNHPNLNLVFDRLYGETTKVPLKYVPDPDLLEYDGKKPEARLFAPKVGINIATEFPPTPPDDRTHRLHGIQTLQYPTDLERQMRKLASEANTAIEETGSNMLFLIFGFLEFYDSDDSEKPLLAPLISLPVSIVKGGIDLATRTYQYSLQHNGEDVAENFTLLEKMRRDFTLALPALGDEPNPESYFEDIQNAVNTRRRWRVRRQLTLGMLSFGKLAIWAGLDTRKYPGIVQHPLIKSIFSGKTSDGSSALLAEDYQIDSHTGADQPLIFDADSSQHSALIDVLAGKNLVINGPPGTGKSQTITNIVAAALSQGKKVLFVSEKLAALEVVRRRLDAAGLGHFCLELHSHKTQKKKLLEDIDARIKAEFRAPPQLKSKLTSLLRQKAQLARYAELMGSSISNKLGLTINEIFWAAERRRLALGELNAQINSINCPDASNWVSDDLAQRISSLASLAELFETIGGFDATHQWWGFTPRPLAPTDDEKINRLIEEALHHAIAGDSAATAAVSYFALRQQPDLVAARNLRAELNSAPRFPENAYGAILPRLFDREKDPSGLQSHRHLDELKAGILLARQLFQSASLVLVDGVRYSAHDTEELLQRIKQSRLKDQVIGKEVQTALSLINEIPDATNEMLSAARLSNAPFSRIATAALSEFVAGCAFAASVGLSVLEIGDIKLKAAALRETIESLLADLQVIKAIAANRSFQFDSTLIAVKRLASMEADSGVQRDVIITDELRKQARVLAAHPLASRPPADLKDVARNIQAEASAFKLALERCRQVSQRLGLAFTPTDQAVAELDALVKVSLAAPQRLMEYRRSTFEQSHCVELVAAFRGFIEMDRASVSELGQLFYLDAALPLSEIRSAVLQLRTKDGLFAIFDSSWRRARALHNNLSIEKRKLTAKQRSEELVKLATWLEARESFESNHEFKDYFGSLFRGRDTDIDAIEELCSWYVIARKTLFGRPGLVEKINVNTLSAERIAELAASASAISVDTQRLLDAEHAIQKLLPAAAPGFRTSKARDWDSALRNLEEVCRDLAQISEFFTRVVSPKYLPKIALNVLETKADLDAAAEHLDRLINAQQSIIESGGVEFGKLIAIDAGRIDDSLKKYALDIDRIASTVSQAVSFGLDNVPLASAERFAKAKLAFDSTWMSIFTAPTKEFTSWETMTNFAMSDYEAADSVISLVQRSVRSGFSSTEFVDACVKEVEANRVIANLTESTAIQSLFQSVFFGANTDIELIEKTHAWGSAICALNLPKPLRERLLSKDASETLEQAQQLYGTIDDSCTQAKAIVQRLDAYGPLVWDDWQSSARAKPYTDLPSEIRARLERAASSSDSILNWSRYLMVKEQAKVLDLNEFVQALETCSIPQDQVVNAFELSAYQSIGRAIYQSVPELSRFNAAAHDRARAEYQQLDDEIIKLNGDAFAHTISGNARIPEGTRGTTVGEYSEMNLLRREINKQRRHIPIRQLINRAGNALLELKPVFMMGPLSVAQYLEFGALDFDLVVMDEASQLRPEDAIGAVARGSQLVVVGDPKQLPPTNFFDRMVDSGDEDDDDAPAAVSGMESILDICQQLFTPIRSLRWHYRSQHESLIAFSNHHFYKNLVVFPSPYAKSGGLGIKYRYLKNGVYKDRRNVPEAQKVVDAVLDHILKHPDESLGVVTLNQTQRELIEELLEKKLKSFPEGADFIGHWENEGWPFFIKNLENVQGDERDVIFISTTFGKAPETQRVRQNFGPISRPDGWRRLNVLFTRSRRRIELFTSMSPDDIVTDEKTPLGTKALRDYLDFAKRGVLVTTDEGEREPDSDFEISVASVIESMGYQVKPQLGVAGFFIDMVVRNPDRPGEFMAAIECDGASYHSGASVRDRDRIRQEILESLGWKEKIFRIWSTDWFYNPRESILRLRSFLDDRRRASMFEPPSNYDPVESDWVVEDEEPATVHPDDPSEGLAPETISVSDGDDMFVEVGYRVTFMFVDTPADKHSVTIVDSESNSKLRIYNENTPLAQALLGLSVGETGVLRVAENQPRELKVLNIQGQD